MKFDVVLLGTENNSSQNTGIHAMANEVRRNGMKAFCIDYLELFSDEQIKELADRINAITVNNPIIGINTNFVFEEKNFIKIVSLLKPHQLVLGGVNRLFNLHDLKPIDLRGTSRETEFVKLCFAHFNINKEPMPFAIENLKHNYTDDDVYPEGVSVPFQISRHCIFNCTFCNSVENRAKRLNWRRIELMVEQMEEAQKRYKTNKFICTANTFNDYAEKCEEFLGALKNHSTLNNVRFFAFMRFDMLMKQEAVWPLFNQFVSSTFFGIETLHDKDSFFIRKGMRIDQRKADILKAHEAMPRIIKMYGLIHGLPNSTEEQTEESVKWLIDSRAADMVALSPLTISDQSEDFHASDLSLDPIKFGYTVSTRRPDVEKGFAKIISRTQLDWVRKSDGYTSEQAQNFVKKIFNTYNMRPYPERDPNRNNFLTGGANSPYFKNYVEILTKRLQFNES